MLGADHPDTIASEGNLAAAYQAAGRLDEAIARYERTLADAERALGPDDASTIAIRCCGVKSGSLPGLWAMATVT